MRQNNMVGMILAGGRGSRLYALTNKVAKPAVYFGGKYRIIDFPISNCANSNIDVVGVLTQYESVLLNAYASAGHRWGLDSQDSGVFVLPPREKADADLNVYRGTADAITQNIDFLDQYDPEYVLVLSGDHIYKMDYADMLAFHKANNADCTIAVMPVPMEEASRFGIMNTDKEKRIIEFEEKPAVPKSNLASMGIYIFNYKALRKSLLADEKVEDSAHDFGKTIIPEYLNSGKRLFAYEFTGYWKDVGTVTSLWEANMDLIYNSGELDLNDPSWKIYTQNQPILPHYIGSEATVASSYINQGAVIEGTVEGSVLSHDVEVAKGAIVKDSVIMPGVKIGEGAVVTRCIVAEGVQIDAGAVVGSADSKEIELVSERVRGDK